MVLMSAMEVMAEVVVLVKVSSWLLVLMPLPRILNTLSQASLPCPFNEDVVMTDATMSNLNIPPSSPIAPAAPSCSVDGPALLGKHRHHDKESSKHHSQPTACPSTPLSIVAYLLTPAIPPLI